MRLNSFSVQATTNETPPFRSTMCRAMQTAALIQSQIDPDEFSSVSDSDLIREGAPVAPEPPVPKDRWYVEDNVSAKKRR